MRVLLADDRSEVRWALRTVIREEPGLSVVGEVSDTEDLLAEVQALQPDLILLEWELPGQPVEELLSVLRVLDGQPRVIILGQEPGAEQAAYVAGADDFVNKANGAEKLLCALRRLAWS
jgi:DNA-binding NarL/FixJ family response regulator